MKTEFRFFWGLRERGQIIVGKPSPYPGDYPVRKPRPKPQEDEFIKEKEFLV